MGCCTNCDCSIKQAMVAERPPLPRYNVSANKSSYVSENFDNLEDAARRLAELASEGYGSVHLRDNEGDGDIW